MDHVPCVELPSRLRAPPTCNGSTPASRGWLLACVLFWLPHWQLAGRAGSAGRHKCIAIWPQQRGGERDSCSVSSMDRLREEHPESISARVEDARLTYLFGRSFRSTRDSFEGQAASSIPDMVRWCLDLPQPSRVPGHAGQDESEHGRITGLCSANGSKRARPPPVGTKQYPIRLENPPLRWRAGFCPGYFCHRGSE